MCMGLSFTWRDLPQALIQRHKLQNRVIVRNERADREIRFFFRDPRPLLPVWIGNQLTICSWGNQDHSSKLPRTAWARQESLEQGVWQHLRPERVEIPASYGFERGIWFRIRQGLRGILVHDEQRGPHIYLLTEPASHYYCIMTRSDRMPVLIEEKI